MNCPQKEVAGGNGDHCKVTQREIAYGKHKSNRHAASVPCGREAALLSASIKVVLEMPCNIMNSFFID